MMGDARAATPWPSLATHWKRRFGRTVWRVPIDAGFGCPHRGAQGQGGCAFCDPASFAPSTGSVATVTKQLKAGMTRLQRKGIDRFAAYFQPHTNTFGPLARLREVWDEAAAFDEVVALCVGTRPDCVDDPVLDLLASYRERFGEIWLELGLQSANDATLTRINRGHDAAAFADGCARARARGLKVCAHVILGLPGETPDDEARTAAFVRRLGVEGVKFHHLAIVRGTALEASYADGEFEVLGPEEYARRAAAFVRGLDPGTVLHRLVGDSAGDRLIAPRYQKQGVVEAIRALLE